MPDAAEAEAERLGFGKLANTPDPSEFDPMEEAWWTLPMVIAWIASRSSETVREYWDRYRSVCVEWHFCEWRMRADGPVQGGHLLARRLPATISSLYLAEKRNWENTSSAAEMTSIDDAKTQLWAALGQNKVQAAGIDTDTNVRTPIPDYAWLDLADIEERGRDVLRFREPRGGLSSRGYDNVVFRRQNILAIWQPRFPEEFERDLTTPLVTKTGAPGRPSSMHLVEREYRARGDRGDTNARIGEEAKVLSEWLQTTHPDAPRLTPKTIANQLRHEHRERMRKAQK
jgi:hypothetical protein